METSPSIKEIAVALKGFQAAATPVKKDGTNPHFKSRFATLDNVLESIKAGMQHYGLSYVQLPDTDGLTTILMHESGEWIRATAKLTLDKQTPQGQGSAITYMRRYALSAALGIATEDDDDGNEASKAPQTRQNAPGASKPAATKKETDIRLEADKDRLKTLLKHLGCTDFTVKGVKDAVLKFAGETYDIENIDRINNTLSGKLEAKEAAAEQ